MEPPPGDPGGDGPEKLVEPTERVMDGSDMREVLSGRPFLRSAASPEGQIVHGHQALEGGLELMVQLQQVRLDGREVHCRVGAFPGVERLGRNRPASHREYRAEAQSRWLGRAASVVKPSP